MVPHGREMSPKRRNVISLYKKGQLYKKIRNALLINWNTVVKVIYKFKKWWTCFKLSPTNRPSIEANTSSVLWWVEENRLASSSAKAVESQTGMTMTQYNIHCRRVARKGVIHNGSHCSSPYTRKARFAFARVHADKYEDYSDNTLWSNETQLNMFGTVDIQTVWPCKGEKYN